MGSYLWVADNGFLPLKGVLDTMRIAKGAGDRKIQFDSLKIAYLKKFIENTGKSKIIFLHQYGMVLIPQPYNQLGNYTKRTTFHSWIIQMILNSFIITIYLKTQGADVFTNRLVKELGLTIFAKEP